MKKFLSMVLALVMVMSLVTVSAGAKDFTDNDTITYEEAVAVVSEVGIVDGYTDGKFNPTNTLTRQAAAKIICNLILGPTTAAELHADTAPYRDVPANGEFAGYIAYCQSRGIISGYADGTFRPGGTLTGYAFMKMLLGALGYDAALEGYVGANWSINVAKQALGIGLNKGLEGEFNGIKAVTREEACLYAFRTLQADLVEYGQRLTTNINGTEVTLSSGGAHSRRWDGQSQMTKIENIRVDDIIQFAEEYFRKLEKKKTTDDFERPAYTWIYDKNEIGTYVDWELLVEEYSTGVDGRDLYDLLGSAVIRDNDLAYYVNGMAPGSANPTATDSRATLDEGDNILKKDLVRANDDSVGVTGRGVLTQVFLDKDIDLITIVSINTWLAQASGDYSESKEYAPLGVFWNSADPRTWNVDVEDVPAVADVKDEGFYLVNITYKYDRNGEVVTIAEPEILEDSTVTKFSQNSGNAGGGRVSKLTTGGTEYSRNVKAYYDADVLDEYDATLLTDKTYNVYLDQFGNFIGVSLFEGALNYVFITGYDRPTSNLSISTADAAGIFLDGTMDVIKVNVTDTNRNIAAAERANNTGSATDDFAWEYFIDWATLSNDGAIGTSVGKAGAYRLNRWFTYSVNESGVYTLKPAVRMTATKYTAATTIKTDSVYVTDNVLDSTLPATANHPYSVAVLDAYGSEYGAARNPQYRSYGNDNSVFITVDLDEVDTNSYLPKAITEVTGVFTGVQDVEIEIAPKNSNVSGNAEEAEVYTVYDKNYYIIGAVIVGEAKGSNATIAYVLGDAKSEEKKGDTYYWEFDVIMGGEERTLTAKSKYTTIFDTINFEATDHGSKRTNATDGIVELRFDSEDYVVDVKPVKESTIYSKYGTKNTVGQTQDSDNNGVRDLANLSLSDAKVYRMNVLYGGSFTDDVPTLLTLKGRTLYVTPDQSDEGLALTGDCKAVTIQTENREDEVVTEFTSVSGALSHLADANPAAPGLQYDGEIVAVVNGAGAAEWIVFYNYTPLVAGNQNSGRFDMTDYEVRVDPATNALTVLKDGAAPTLDEAMQVVNQWLRDEKKATDIDVVWNGTAYLFTVTYQTEGGMAYRVIYSLTTANLKAGTSMNVDGKAVVTDGAIDEDSTPTQAYKAVYGASESPDGTYALVTTNKGKTYYCAVGSSFDTASGWGADELPEAITFGFVQLTVTGTTQEGSDTVDFYKNTSTVSVNGKDGTLYVEKGAKITITVTLGDMLPARAGLGTVPANVTLTSYTGTDVDAGDAAKTVKTSDVRTGRTVTWAAKATGDGTITAEISQTPPPPSP